MRISRDSYRNILISIIIMLIGFGKFKLVLPLVLLFSLMLGLDLLRGGHENREKRYFKFLTFNTFFVILLFLIGWNNIIIDSKINALISMLLITVILIIMSGIFIEKKSLILDSFIFGLTIYSFGVIFYSLVNNPYFYGYKRLFDPFYKMEINSPAISNNLILIFMISFHNCIYRKNGLEKTLAYVLLPITIIGAIFLGARLFFLAAILYILLNVKFIMRKNYLLSIIILLTLLLVILACIILINEDMFSYYYKLISERFRMEGIKSGRYNLWQAAIHFIPNYPFGGFSTQNIEGAKFFHNMWLDIARIAGWVPLFLFICGNLYYIIALKKYLVNNDVYKDKEYAYYLILGAIVFIIMFQDVIIEGNKNIYFFYLIVITTLIQMMPSKKRISTL